MLILTSRWIPIKAWPNSGLVGKKRLLIKKKWPTASELTHSRQHYWGRPIPIIMGRWNFNSCSKKWITLVFTDWQGHPPFRYWWKPMAPAAVADDSWRWCQGSSWNKLAMPQWAGSSWYYLLLHRSTQHWEISRMRTFSKQWLPVISVCGWCGACRFFTCFMLVSQLFSADASGVTTEPFQTL